MSRKGVFISHAHEDRDLAESLAALVSSALGLVDSDITCTSDAEFGLERGRDVKEQITSRLTSARALFLLATPASRKSDWVNRECGQADAERERGLAFHIVTPFRNHSDVIPAPYIGLVAVTTSHAEDLLSWIKQLRREFGRTEPDDYSDCLVDLIDRSARVERAREQALHESRVTDIAAQSQRLAKQKRVLGVAAGVLLSIAAISIAWVMKGERDHAAEISRLAEQHHADLSEQLNAAQMASDEEFRQFAFAGMLQDSQNRRVPCSSVEAHVRDSLSGGERLVPKSCDGSGAFAFSAPELKNDARIPIRLRVLVGNRPYDLVVRLAEARLALLVPSVE